MECARSGRYTKEEAAEEKYRAAVLRIIHRLLSMTFYPWKGARRDRLVAEAAGPSAEALGAAAMGKFIDDARPSGGDGNKGGPITLSYGDMKDFQRGLSGLVGPPAEGDAGELMAKEHCERNDSQSSFTVGNYGTITSSEVEYHFVADPEKYFGGGDCLEIDGKVLMDWPREAERVPPEHRRVAVPLSDYELKRDERHQRLQDTEGLSFPELMMIAARLYTGPMFVKVRRAKHGSSNMPGALQPRYHPESFITSFVLTDWSARCQPTANACAVQHRAARAQARFAPLFQGSARGSLRPRA